MMDNINASCPSDGRPFTPENAMTYDCPEDCARTLTTTWYYCQTSFYLRSKEWPTEGRMALRTLVSQDPPGPCTQTEVNTDEVKCTVLKKSTTDTRTSEERLQERASKLARTMSNTRGGCKGGL